MHKSCCRGCCENYEAQPIQQCPKPDYFNCETEPICQPCKIVATITPPQIWTTTDQNVTFEVNVQNFSQNPFIGGIVIEDTIFGISNLGNVYVPRGDKQILTYTVKNPTGLTTPTLESSYRYGILQNANVLWCSNDYVSYMLGILGNNLDVTAQLVIDGTAKYIVVAVSSDTAINGISILVKVHDILNFQATSVGLPININSLNNVTLMACTAIGSTNIATTFKSAAPFNMAANSANAIAILIDHITVNSNSNIRIEVSQPVSYSTMINIS